MRNESESRSPLADVRVEPGGHDRTTLVFVRELRHDPERVWSALTSPAELRRWAPFDPDRDLGTTGPAKLAMAGAPEPMETPANVLRAERPRLLEYTWGGDLLRWELEPTARGTRLTLRQTIQHRAWVPRVAAGWHLCLDVADRALAGEPVARIVGPASRDHGWVEANDAYADRLGIPSKGWPTPEQIKAQTG